MADIVLPWGSKAAKLVLIGEAPGRWEHVYGMPFVGPSYTDHLKRWWTAAGLVREQFYILNVLDYQPNHIDRVSEYEMRAAFDVLHMRLAELDDPWLIVPTGNYALYALTGKGRVSFHNKDGRWDRPGITQHRGSILMYEDRRGRKVKVIPTVHPANMFRDPERIWIGERDWKRIAEDSQFRELRLPERTHMISPSIAEVREYANWTCNEAARRAKTDDRLICSGDVETPNKTEYGIKQKESTAATAKCATCGHTKRWHEGCDDRPGHYSYTVCCKRAPKKDGGRQCTCGAFLAPMGKPRQVKVNEYSYLGCVGYSWNPKLSLTVPTTLAYWHEQSRLDEVLAILRGLHGDPNIDWLGQNYIFDGWWCAVEGVPFSQLRWDTMKLHRVLAPWSHWHDLAFQGSLYTRQPYWKDEAKDPDSISKYAHNNEALWTYNGIDNCVQIELGLHHIPALREAGRLDYYEEMEAPVDNELLALSLAGVRFDEAGGLIERERVMAEGKEVAVAINEHAGRPLFGKAGKAVSNTKMVAFLYGADGLRLPEQYATSKDKGGQKVKKVTVNVVAIKRLMERFPGLTQLQEVGARVLKHRRLMKVAGFLKPERLVNGRWFALFKQDTIFGRLSSAATPKGDGANLQNADRKLRRFFLPEATL